MIESMGTFINTFYPYKNIVQSFCQAYTEVQNQLTNNVTELTPNLARTIIEHLELYYYIDLSKLDTCPIIGTSIELEGMCGAPVRYSLPDKVLSIEKITDKIYGSTITLFPGTDYRIEYGTIFFTVKPTQLFLWGHNAKIESPNFSNAVGFIYKNSNVDLVNSNVNLVNSNVDLVMLLLNMARYGITEESLVKFFTVLFGHPYILEDNETVISLSPFKTDKNNYDCQNPILSIGKAYSRLTPITNNVKIESNPEFLKYMGRLVKHNILRGENIFDGIAKWGQTVWDTTPISIDEYDSVKNVCVITVKYTPINNDLSLINNIKNLIPPWMILNINLEHSTLDIPVAPTESQTVLPGKSITECYNKFVDTAKTYTYWGLSVWGGTYYLHSPDINIIRNYK